MNALFRNLFYDCIVNEQVGSYIKVENKVVFIGYHKSVKYLTIYHDTITS